MRTYTKAQQEYRDKLLRKKPKKTKELVVPEPVVHPRSWYMKNCIMRVEWYEQGRATIKEVESSLKHLERHITELHVEICKKSLTK